MALHIGERIKARAKELRIGPTELADMINTSKQNVYGIYKRRAVDSELLKKLSLALKFDFFSAYYDKQWQKSFQESQAPYQNKAAAAAAALKEELTKLKKEHQELQEKYEMLKRLYELTEEKLKGKKEGATTSSAKTTRKTK